MADLARPPRPTGRPVVLGEVLFDRFPDGHAVLGGAPFNVAWHLQGFGLNPLFASRIGDDEAGHQVLDTMRRFGMETRGIQIDPDRATGRVHIEFVDRQHTFDIPSHQAWDRIDPGPIATTLRGVATALLYHGSLLARTPEGLRAIQTLRGALCLPVFVDVNLRDPWWTPATVDALLSGARWIKLNGDELHALSDRPLDDVRAATRIKARTDCECLYVTRGAESTVTVNADGIHEIPTPQVDDIVDTVGAGDAFSAVILLGLLRDWPSDATIERATEFAASVCRMRGATTEDRALYEDHLRRWKN